MTDTSMIETEIGADGVAQVRLNRPEKRNAIHEQGWHDLKRTFETLDQTPKVRVIVLSGVGKGFCSGIDVSMLMSLPQMMRNDCDGRAREQIRGFIHHLQSCISAIEKCRKPVLAAIHGMCIGGALDIVTACDMRYCAEDAYFSIKEVDMGIVADIGTTQRLPKLIGDGMMRELAYTGRNVDAAEADNIGLVNRTFADQAACLEGVTEIAQQIASKSPLVIRGTKQIIKYMRDHSVEDGLEYISTWNAAFLMSADLMEAMQASMLKRPAEFID